MSKFLRRNAKFYRRKSNRMKVIVRDGKRCSYCDADDVDLELDHIIPRSRGGLNSINNLVLSCRECNLAKGDMLPHEIQDIKLKERVKQLRRYANSKSNWS